MMLVTKLLVSLMLIFPVAAVCQLKRTDASSYIGYKYKGVLPGKMLPNGVKHFGGGLIGDVYANPVYGISEVAHGKTKMFWLEASTGQDAAGITGWQVKDVLTFPVLAKTDYLLFALDPSIECTRNNAQVTDDLVAIGRIYRRKGAFIPTKAWIANLVTAKFDKIPTAGLKCTYSEP